MNVPWMVQLTKKRVTFAGLSLAVLIGLTVIAQQNYLLFHSLVEIFSICVAFSTFVIAWNSRKFHENLFLFVVGIGYGFIGFLDLLHTLTYEGMKIFPSDIFYANQLWIGTRLLEATALFTGFILLADTKRKPGSCLIPSVYLVITTVIILSIFTFEIFPTCFVKGVGQTAFKVNMEYVVCLILCADIFLLHRKRRFFEDRVRKVIFWSLVLTVASELFFTFYISNFGISNILGHFAKLASFYLLYLAVVETGVLRSHQLIFRQLCESRDQLGNKVLQLEEALEKVSRLQKLVPLCAWCKKARNDQGYWQEVDRYLSEQSDLAVSYGICSDCTTKMLASKKSSP